MRLLITELPSHNMAIIQDVKLGAYCRIPSILGRYEFLYYLPDSLGSKKVQ